MPESTIRIMCPSLMCRKILAVPVSSRGKTVKCRNCGSTIRVPVKADQPADQSQTAESDPKKSKAA